MNAIPMIGLYPDTVNDKIGTAIDAVCTFCGDQYEREFVNESVERLKEIGSFEDITNSCILAFFITAKDYISQKARKNVEYYINCTDSHLYVDGEEV